MRKIGIIGLGYVGLPLLEAFSEYFEVVGFDINEKRINELKLGIDSTNELNKQQAATLLDRAIISSDPEVLKSVDFFIVTVPTPIDEFNNPDLTPLISASKLISKYLKKDDIVVYESTVYPGATEEICIPLLGKGSLEASKDFFYGYSPERINPGDKVHTLKNIKKVVSGCSETSLKIIESVYSIIISAGVYKASSVRVAEAAKVIENSQRDLNIAFINEISIIFNKMNLRTNEVLEAAATKWNFLNFQPGLVGGHCIGVDPYYLAHKAKSLGYVPRLILGGREINDTYHIFITNFFLKQLKINNIDFRNSNILILGATFKEDCPDLRNSKVFDLFKELSSIVSNVKISDCLADRKSMATLYNNSFIEGGKLNLDSFEAIIIAVAHKEYKEMNFEKVRVVLDLKNALPNQNLIRL